MAKNKPAGTDADAPSVTDQAVARQGLKRGFFLPGIAMGATMAGFGTFAHDMGIGFVVAIAATLSTWSMPGMMVFVTLLSANADMVLMFVAIALANIRTFLIVLSSVTLMDFQGQKIGFFRQLFLAQFLSPTSWTEITAAQSRFQGAQLLAYFKGMSFALVLMVVAGVTIGFYLHPFIPLWMMAIPLFIMPLYLSSLVVSVRHRPYLVAALTGGAIGPLSYPFAGEWSILLAGAAGCAALAAYEAIVKGAHDDSAV
ncbi:MAG: AzlC family ABC transporter permease [Parvibaculales bacterium]